MAISLRHFVITIIAIFLALGVGIFIGAIMDSQQLFIAQQKQLVTQIEDEFSEFKQRNFELLTQLENQEIENNKKDIFINNVYRDLIQDRLEGLNILTINISDQQNFEDVLEVLNSSGANNILQVTIKNLNQLDLSNYILENEGLNLLNKTSVSEQRALLIKNILKSIIENNPIPNIESDIVDILGDINASIDYAIIFDGSYKEDSQDEILIKDSTVDAINESKMPMMVVEKLNINYSTIPYYKNLGISTVDNVDTRIGKISMLMVISGMEGNYGEKDSADNLMPDSFLY